MVEGHGNIPKVEKTRVHQVIMVNNFIIIGEEVKLSTDNDDLYVKCEIMELSTRDMHQKGQLSFEQNPRNLPFHYTRK